jgi:hypothetical protein
MRGRPRTKLAIVEDCLSLDIGDLFFPDTVRDISIQWQSAVTGELLYFVSVHLPSIEATTVGIVEVKLCDADGATIAEQQIALNSTRPFFGGLRHWFVCPLSGDHGRCNQRSRVLYIPPGASLFGCRACYDLTYQSCRDCHRYDRLFAGLARLMPGATAESMKAFLEGTRP